MLHLSGGGGRFSGQLAMMGQADQLAAQAAQDQPAPQRPGAPIAS
jgi:hypothetical protein